MPVGLPVGLPVPVFLIVGDGDTDRPVVGLGDFDEDGDAFPVVAPTLTLGPSPPTTLPGCDALGDAPVRWAADGDDV